MKILVILGSIVVVLAGLKAAAAIVVPLLLAIFIAIICIPPTKYLERKGVPDSLAIGLVLIAVFGIGFLLMSYLGASLTSFTRSLPTYEAALSRQLAKGVELLQGYGLDVSTKGITEYFDPSIAMKMVSSVFSSLSEILANFFLIILTVVFILLEAANMPRKMQVAFGGAEATVALQNFSKIGEGINKYLALKSVISLATGALIAMWLAILGVDFPVLWGVMAFMLNYVPNIGSLIAAVPAVLLALIQLGWLSSLLVASGYVLANIVMGSVIEPRLMGRGVGLSTLVVFLSLIFWGWVLGPVGMLLSVPLTMVVKIAFESNESTHWIGILLGPDQPEAMIAEAHDESEKQDAEDEAKSDAENA